MVSLSFIVSLLLEAELDMLKLISVENIYLWGYSGHVEFYLGGKSAGNHFG